MISTPLLAFVLAAPAAGRAHLQLNDLARIVSLAEPRLSPDGRSVVVVVSRPNWPDNRYERELILVDAASGTSRVLTRDRSGLEGPQFSTQGDRIAFLAHDDAMSAAQVFVLSLLGGDALRVTRAPGGVDRMAFSPDGNTIAFVSAEPPLGDEALGPFEVGNNSYLATAAPRSSHLWLVPAEGGEARRLTHEPGSLATGLGTTTLSWSPDGRRIALTRWATAASGDYPRGHVEVVDVVTGRAVAITGSDSQESGPQFSPDGKDLAYSYPLDGDPVRVSEVYLAPASGGGGRSLTRALDRSLGLFAWMPRGAGLVVGGNDGTRVSLWTQPLTGPARRIELGPVMEFTDLDVGRNGTIAIVGSEALHPPELYLLEPGGSAPRRITSFNDGVAGLELGRSEPLEWTSPDGVRADGVLTFPPGFDPGRRWPLVLYIHGGPTAASNQGFDGLSQLMAAHGLVVFQPNYRGSDNRGDDFQRGIVTGAGSGPGRDVWAGLEAVKRRGFVDDKRLAVSGWSYGGFMTVWMIGNYPGFRAAVAGAAALDIEDMYSLSDLNVARRHAITGSPWTEGRLEAYRAESPLSHATRIKTPTLILSNTGDTRVAISQSYKLFRALKDNGVKTRFFAYPTSGHLPVGPRRQQDAYRRWLDWISEHIH